MYEDNNKRSEQETAEEIRKALESTPTLTKTEAPKLQVLTDELITFSDTRQEVRFAISDASHTIKYRIDGGETTTLSAHEVEAGVCEVELPQRDCMLTMWCVGGEPHMIRYCYDRETSARKSATLYILSIGLNDYQDPNLDNLRYAENDARDIVTAITDKHKNTFANIDAQLLVGRDVTSEKISEKLNYLADKATASDMAVIFFAGHGLVDERDRYYLSTYNVTNATTPRRGGYSSSTFIEDISYIDCKLLVFIDACYSGKLLEGYRGSVSSENFFREMNSTPNGTCIYTSSSKEVKSRESAEHKHGIFTQALIESFEFEKSDNDNDNRITVIEVRNYLEKRIPQLTGNKQKPIYRNIEEIDFPLFIK
ncbi:MAG: caspase family protein [Bacteroidales bacterium]|nr:caspase family protein [Bacteroidales bacterium]